MKNIEVVILANSVKHQQHCVAGKCIANGQWVRPVSNADGAELSHAQALCKNPYGQFNVKPLQKVIMSFSTHAPLSHQPENYVIDGSVWRQNFGISVGELDNYLDTLKKMQERQAPKTTGLIRSSKQPNGPVTKGGV